MRIRFTPSAKEQFLTALAYIRRDKPEAVKRFRKKTESALKRLERFPESGRSIPEFPDLPFREVLVPPYRFFYRIKGKTIWVVGAWHTSQEPGDVE